MLQSIQEHLLLTFSLVPKCRLWLTILSILLYTLLAHSAFSSCRRWIGFHIPLFLPLVLVVFPAVLYCQKCLQESVTIANDPIDLLVVCQSRFRQFCMM